MKINSQKNKIGIVGSHGMVGSCVRKWFEGRGKVYCYDKGKNIGSAEEVNKADIIFVAVPTPYKNEGYDLSILEETIAKIPDGKIVVIKSTVNPGTTDAFQTKYPNKKFIFNPEFLTELSAEKDFQNPDMQILGVSKESYNLATKIMLMLPPAPIMRVVSLIDAEWIKKIRNAFYATKIVFFNQIYDIIQKSEPADYETIRSIVIKDPRIGNSHSFIYHKGGRGGGGKCLPKDLKSLLGFAKTKNVNTIFLSMVNKLNEEYLKKYPKNYE